MTDALPPAARQAREFYRLLSSNKKSELIAMAHASGGEGLNDGLQ
jgi:hypothetical protein